MKKLLFLILGWAPVLTLHAQYIGDALRYSQTYSGGSPRMLGMAGTQYALGADLSNLSDNPAGLGFYRSSEIGFSPTLSFSNTSGDYLGQRASGYDAGFYFSNFGLVFSDESYRFKTNEDQSLIKALNFGVGYNRTNYLGRRIDASALNQGSSMAQFFSAMANDYGIADGIPSYAYDFYIINYNQDSSGFEPATRGGNTQTISVDRSGRQDHWSLAMGMNLDHKVFLGASLGIYDLSFSMLTSHRETGIVDTVNGLSQFTFSDRLIQSGSGVDFNLGLILRPNDVVRLGFSARTPVFYSIDEDYSAWLSSKAAPGGNARSFSQRDPVRYLNEFKLRTPARFNGGMALFAGKKGFVSGDMEYLVYSSTELKSGIAGTDYNQENQYISTNFKPQALNLRIGGEYNTNPVLLRAGYAWYDSPLLGGRGVDLSKMVLSMGAGLRMEDWSLDLSYQRELSSSSFVPYSLSTGEQPSADLEHIRSSVALGLQFRF